MIIGHACFLGGGQMLCPPTVNFCGEDIPVSYRIHIISCFSLSLRYLSVHTFLGCSRTCFLSKALFLQSSILILTTLVSVESNYNVSLKVIYTSLYFENLSYFFKDISNFCFG